MAWHVVNVPGLEWLKTINDTKVRVLNGVVWPVMQESNTRCGLLDVMDTASWDDGVKVLVLNEVG